MGRAMASAKPERNDVAIAQKAINLARGLSGADKAVAAAIIDHFNKVTGQCDPSIERLATLLDLDERTIRRATADLCAKHGMFLKRSHGGKSLRASYAPIWSTFRDIVTEWDNRMRGANGPLGGPFPNAENRAEMSGSTPADCDNEPDIFVHPTGQKCPIVPGRNVLQTHIRNPSYEPISASTSVRDAARDPETLSFGVLSQGLLRRENLDLKPPGYQARERAATSGCSRSEAALIAAQRRLDQAIAQADTSWRSDMWTLTDETDRNHAITAELKRRGEGIACLQAAVRLARLRDGASNHVH